MQYSGVLGIGVMSVAMVLAVRPVWFESTLGGLDKMYRLHKWLGIAGLALAVSHWLLAQGGQVGGGLGVGWCARQRGPRACVARRQPGCSNGCPPSAGWLRRRESGAFYAGGAADGAGTGQTVAVPILLQDASPALPWPTWCWCGIPWCC
jgi:hypothetical protein